MSRVGTAILVLPVTTIIVAVALQSGIDAFSILVIPVATTMEVIGVAARFTCANTAFIPKTGLRLARAMSIIFSEGHFA